MGSSNDSSVEHVVVLTKPDGREAADGFVAALESAAASAGRAIETSIIEPDSQDAVIGEARRAAENGALAVVSVGGDGTLNLVAEGIAGSDTALAVVGAGTVNLFAQVLGLTDAAATARSVAAGSRRTVDLASTDAGVFVLNASSGYDAGVIADGEDHGDARFGRLHFLIAGIKRLRRDRPRRVSVTIDGEPWFSGRAMSVIVLNVGERASANFHVAPDAAMDDGVLDVAVMRCSSLRRVATTGIRLALDRPIDPADVLYGQGTKIDVAWAATVPTQRDGDPDDDAATISHTVEPAALHVYTSTDDS